MSHPIDQVLRTTLLRHQQVALPGLGTFVRRAQSASFDGANRRLLPPGARIEFNGNLRADDGLLAAALQREIGGELAVAHEAIRQFVEQAKGQLLSGEAVEFIGLGKLRSKYGGGFEFTQSDRALERAHQGLPSVAFTPIQRSTRSTGTADPLAAATTTTPVLDPLAATTTLPPPPPPAATPRPVSWSDRLSERNWLILVGTLLVLGAYALYMLLASVLNTTVDEPRRPVRAERPTLSQPRPSREQPATTTTVPARTVSPDEPPRLNAGRRNTGAENQGEAAGAERVEQPAASDIPTPSSRPTPPTRNAPVTSQVRRAVIVTGLFGSAANVEKNLLRYRQAGYEPWSQPKGRYTQVGVEVDYSSDRELADVLRKVRGQFAENAFVRTTE